MKNTSLRSRLMALAIAATTVIVGATGLSFYLLFQRHVDQFIIAELEQHFEQLLSNTVVEDSGIVSIKGRLSDPRFTRPNGGLYWQAVAAGQAPLRSRSLWEETLLIKNPPTTENPNKNATISGPIGVEVFSVQRLVTLPTSTGKEVQVLYVVAEDRARASNAISSFASSMALGLGLAYMSLLAGSALMIALGLKPLVRLQRAVEAVRTGRQSRLSEDVPSEVSPLVHEVNGLVEAREKQLERARQRASNLAHGLKTPLAVMNSIADELKSGGHRRDAVDIRAAADQMHDLVERELAKSRMADGNAAHRTNLAQVTSRIVETLKRAPRGDGLDWDVQVPGEIVLAMDQADVTELLGCLLDNGRKHANSTIRVWHDGTELIIEDDGPGVDDDKLAAILQRGVRLDSTKPGSGLGLAIVSDLADVYGFDLNVSRSPLGGLRVTAGIAALV